MAYIPEAQVAGKTGSLTGKRAPGLNYNWFVGYAPADRPEIAFAVLLANSPKWQIKAHYAARRLVQIYLQRRDSIAEHRLARLTKEGVELPVEGKKTAPTTSPSKPAAAEAVASRKAPAARPDPDALPPVPGPVARPQAASDKSPSGV